MNNLLPNIMSKITTYHISSKLIHWIMAIIIIPQLIIGLYMVQILASDAPFRSTIYSLHKSFGVLAIGLIFYRIINKIINRTPPLPNSLAKWQIICAKIMHYKLYLLMVLMPFSGYLMSNSYGYPVKFFGFTMPYLTQKNYQMAGFYSNCHKYIGYLFFTLIAIHILAAMKHRFFDLKENNVLARISLFNK